MMSRHPAGASPLALVWLRWTSLRRTRALGGLPAGRPAGDELPWLLGFTSFLLGACLFPVTLGVWWAGRDSLGSSHASRSGSSCVLGYFCHLVSLGLTVLALGVLALLAPTGAA